MQQRRLAGWQQFVRHIREASWQEKLVQVNRYVNQFEYRHDQVTYGRGESWATPYEFLVHNGGDCEDFAITKYFLLRSLGIPEQRLQITYVRHHQRHQYHMVLIYQPASHGLALVLDNLTNRIQALASRPEIEPVYGFNSRHLWVLDKFEQRIPAGTANRLGRWRAVLGRMQHQPIGPGITVNG